MFNLIIFTLIVVQIVVASCHVRRVSSERYSKLYIYEDDALLTYNDTIALCKEENATVVKIASRDETLWINNHVKPRYWYWLGITPAANSVPDEYLDHSKLNWSDWSPNHPEGNYNCAAIAVGNDCGRWRLTTCQNVIHAMCEANLNDKHAENVSVNEVGNANANEVTSTIGTTIGVALITTSEAPTTATSASPVTTVDSNHVDSDARRTSEGVERQDNHNATAQREKECNECFQAKQELERRVTALNVKVMIYKSERRAKQFNASATELSDGDNMLEMMMAEKDVEMRQVMRNSCKAGAEADCKLECDDCGREMSTDMKLTCCSLNCMCQSV